MVAAATANKLNIKPLNDMVLIEKIERQSALIALPEGATHDEDLGRVIDVGPGRWSNGAYEPMAVEKGDIVSLISDYPFGEFEFGGKRYNMIRSAYLKFKVEGME